MGEESRALCALFCGSSLVARVFRFRRRRGFGGLVSATTTADYYLHAAHENGRKMCWNLFCVFMLQHLRGGPHSESTV